MKRKLVFGNVREVRRRYFVKFFRLPDFIGVAIRIGYRSLELIWIDESYAEKKGM